jgi:hypothetical protein
MKHDANILRIANDPIAWAHPSWLAHHTVSANYPSRFQNRLLFERAALEPLTPDESGYWPPLFVRHWNELAIAIYLCGARLARGVLLPNNALVKLEYRAERILSYPLPQLDHHIVNAFLPAKADAQAIRHLVLGEGWRCLVGGHPALPVSVLSRARLCLPADCPLPAAVPCERLPERPTCSSAYRQLLLHALGFCRAENH